jgi:hypothetical protein
MIQKINKKVQGKRALKDTTRFILEVFITIITEQYKELIANMVAFDPFYNVHDTARNIP